MLEQIGRLGSLQDKQNRQLWDLAMQYYLRPLILLQETLSL